jgi:orotate phosphoribosyltransferase
MIRTWLRDRREGWILASGAWSPFYFMFREVPSVPDLFRHSVEALTEITEEIHAQTSIDLIVGIASAGVPLAAGVALKLGLPLAYTRKVAGLRTMADLQANTRQWGEHALVEGKLRDRMRYVMIDDVVTGGASKELARRQVELEAERRGIRLTYVATAVVVDRGYPGHQGGDLAIRARHRFYDEVDQILEYGGTATEVQVIRHYLEKPNLFQEEAARKTLLSEQSALTSS